MSVRLNICENQRYGSANCLSLQNFRLRPPHRYPPTVCIAAGGCPLRVSPPRTDYQRVQSLGATRLFARASPSTPSATRNAADRSLAHTTTMHAVASMPSGHPLGSAVLSRSTPSLPLIFSLLVCAISCLSPIQQRQRPSQHSCPTPLLDPRPAYLLTNNSLESRA
jgi:hypothetical protein